MKISPTLARANQTLLILLLTMLVWSASSCSEVDGTSTPDGMPAIGDSVTLKSMLDANIPVGKLIEVVSTNNAGVQASRMVIDLSSHRGFREMSTDEREVSSSNFTLQIFDDDGHSAVTAVGLEVYPHGGADFAHFVSFYDGLSGQSVEVIGYEPVDDTQTFLIRTSVPATDDGVVLGKIDIEGNVDPTTGLVVREQLQVAGFEEETTRIELRVIDATPELLYQMDSQNIEAIVEDLRQREVDALEDAPFPVFGLPSGYLGLELSSAVVYPEWKCVMLFYGDIGSEQCIVVYTLDPRKYPDYGSDHLSPLDQAWVLPGDPRPQTGDQRTEIHFGIAGVGVKVQASSAIVRQVAQDLVILAGPAHLQ